MEIRHLECFRVLAEELHFGRAARRLFIAQPPLSRQIKKLEDELGVRLFDRTNRYVKLTPFGKYFRREVTKIFERIDMIKAHLTVMKEGAAAELRIGFAESVMHSFLPGLLAEFRLRQPQVNTVLSEFNNAGQIAALRAGTIDVGFLCSPTIVRDLTVKVIYKDPLCLILPPNHPLAGAKTVPLDKLAREPFIGYEKGCGCLMAETVGSVCQRAGFFPRIIQTAEINTIIRLVEAGVGWSIVPATICRAYKARVRSCELDKYPERAELAVALNPSRPSPAKDQFLALLESADISAPERAVGGELLS